MATMTVKDAAGATQTVEKPLAPGRSPASASRPIAFSDEDYAILDGIETKLDTLHTDLAALGANWIFDVLVNPTVSSSGAPYVTNDIIGGLLTFTNVARVADEPFVVTGALVTCKSNVVLTPTLVLFNADPNTNSYADNAAYNIAAGDIGKSKKSIPISTLTSHGTPKSYSTDGLFIVIPPIAGTRNIYGLLFDSTAAGVTLQSTSDIGVTLRGIGK